MAMVGRMVAAEPREHAVLLLSDAKMQTDAAIKVDRLKQLKELVVHKEPRLLPELLPYLLELQSDCGVSIRIFLAETVEEIGLKFVEYLPVMVPVLMALLRDENPGIARRAITSGTNLFRNALEQVALKGLRSGQVDKFLQDAWGSVSQFKDAVYPNAFQHGNDGVRFHAVKFVETVILLYTPDPTGHAQPPPEGAPRSFNIAWIAGGHPLLDAGSMWQEASKNLGSLLNQLRTPDVSKLPGPVAIVLVNSLAAIAKRRPSLYGRILPVLLSLGPNCEAIKGVRAVSIVSALKNAFVLLLKCTHAAAVPWRDRLVSALRQMNAGDAAESAVCSIERNLRNSDRDLSSRPLRSGRDERVMENASDGVRKRTLPHENGNQGVDFEDVHGKRLRGTPPPAVNDAMHGASNGTGGVHMEGALPPIQQLIAMFGALVGQGENGAIELLISNLPPDTLADVVIFNMQNLPLSIPDSPDRGFRDGELLQHPPPMLLNPEMMSAPPHPHSLPHPHSHLQPPPADVRRDPRRDPRRQDPRRAPMPVELPPPQLPPMLVPKQEDMFSGGVMNNRDPRASLLARVKHEQPPSSSLPPPMMRVKDEVDEDSRFGGINPYALQQYPPNEAVDYSEQFANQTSGPVVGVNSVLPVVALTHEQQVELCNGAYLRILEGHRAISAAGGSELRVAVLARLTSQSYVDGEALEVLQKHILTDYSNNMGHELALHVLYEIYTAHVAGDSSAATPEKYNKFLLSLAEALRDNLPPSDKSLSKLFGEAPYLPDAALKLLEDLCNPTIGIKELRDERIMQGLTALWSLILQRPSIRETCLKMSLECAVHEIDDVRSKAIRLVANKLYPLSYVAQRIEEFASNMLSSVINKPLSDVDVVKTEGDNEASEATSADVKADSVTEAHRCMSLYFALCTKKPSLLKEIFIVYGSAPNPVKQAIQKYITILARTIGPSSPDLLRIISDPPPGSESLILQVLNCLTEGVTPPSEFITTVKHVYETKLKDAVFVIPILSSLSRDEVLPIFPRLVDLAPDKFQVALTRMLQGSTSGTALTPAEVLIALHGIDPQRDSVPLKKITDACNACLQQRTVFTQQVLAKVLNQLVEQTPLPMLFMRSVIQAVGAFPSLVSFVMDILSRLVNKQIWKVPQLWIGFLKCASQTVPHSFPVLLQLPSAQLENALLRFPNVKPQLAAHASQANVRTSVPRSSLVLLGVITDESSETMNASSAASQQQQEISEAT